MARLLVWFPHGFHAPRMGSQVRALELVRALCRTGHEIQLASGWNPPGSLEGWPPEGLDVMRGIGVAKVHIHRSRMDDTLGWATRKVFGKTGTAPIGSWRFTPPGQKRWFGKLVRRLRPDALVMNYSVSDPLVESAGFDRKRCILETHDLVLLNKRMQAGVEAALPLAPYHPSATSSEILDLDWFKRSRFETPDDPETEICSKYGMCFSISSREADRIRARSGKVVHLPMAMACGPEGNERDGAAILAAGPNAFNVQGYLWFASKVLPVLKARQPDFVLELTGSLSRKVAPIDGVVPMGVVPDLAQRYLKARFAICPVFGGTGQQVKIVEAMAHGLPVVALADPAKESPIVHGVNGLVCRDESEFAEACLALWNDPDQRRRLGDVARDTVRQELSVLRYEQAVSREVSDLLGRIKTAEGGVRE